MKPVVKVVNCVNPKNQLEQVKGIIDQTDKLHKDDLKHLNKTEDAERGLKI